MLAAILLVAAAGAAQPPLQVLAGKPFDALLARTGHYCPASKVRYISPAALFDNEDGFVASLPRRKARRVARAIPRLADGTPRHCANSEGGASCPAGAQLLAFRRAGLLDAFARRLCAHGVARWQ